LVIVNEDKLLLGVVSETDFRLHINLTALAGRRLVASVMSRSVFMLQSEASLQEALNLMQSHRDTCLVVVEAERPVGIITERDVVRLYSGNPKRTDIPVRAVMTAPVLSISLESTINEAAERMLTAKVRHLVVIDAMGRVSGLISEHDLTHAMALRLVDDRLISDGAFLHTLVKTIPDMVWLKDRNGVYLACNPRFERFFGAREKDIVGKTDHDFLPKELADSFREHDRNAIKNNKPCVNEEWVTYTDDGHRELLETLKTPMYDSQGKLIGVLGIARDITERKLAEQALVDSKIKLREQKEFLSSIIESALDAFILMNAAGVIIDWSRQAEKMFGWKRKEAIGRLMHETISPTRYREAHAVGMKLYLSTGVGPVINNRVEISALHRDGHEFPVELSISQIKTLGGCVISAFVRDISNIKLAEENLRLTASVFENSREAILITDEDNRIVDVNPAFTDITGYNREEVLGVDPKLLNSGRQDKAFYTEMWQALQNKKAWRGEVWNRRKSGEIYAELLSISVICDDRGSAQRYVGVFSDISYLKETEAELSHAAHYDALTGIPNRVLLAECMKLAIAQATRDRSMVAVCYLDLDGFKAINDSLGHKAGDTVLIDVSRRISNTIRTRDIVARLGGDEFVVLLELKNMEECLVTLERLLAVIAQPITIEHQTLRVGVSIGVSLYPMDYEDPDTLLRHADQAMYIAKQSGKNRYCIYDTELNQRTRIQTEFLASIRHGLMHNQFELYYQPKINLRSKQLVGAEALIRWRHAERGLLSPVDFLHPTENFELDIEIGNWVIATALAQIKHWRAGGLDLEVSINISAYHLESEGFTENLRQQLASRSDDWPVKLQIEVLESAAFNDLANVREIIEDCQKFGVEFALDDFGVGYSSLSCLSKLPIEMLKIDQSFVRDMLEDKGDKAIVQAIIAMAKAFGRRIIAEGIETEEQYQALLAMDCELGQGYGIAPPMPADEMEKWRCV
jgi:diguanylate cyclase (GGDEF)-like protein/PAS domain S-box-containing protein